MTLLTGDRLFRHGINKHDLNKHDLNKHDLNKHDLDNQDQAPRTRDRANARFTVGVKRALLLTLLTGVLTACGGGGGGETDSSPNLTDPPTDPVAPVNQPPTLAVSQSSLVMTSDQEKTIFFQYHDADGDPLTVSVETDSEQLETQLQDNVLTIKTVAADIASTHAVDIAISDGAATTIERVLITIEQTAVLGNRLPQVRLSQTSVTLPPTAQLNIPVDVVDLDGDFVTVSVTDDSPAINASYADGLLTLNSDAASVGSQTTVTLTADDGVSSVSVKLQVETAQPSLNNGAPVVRLAQEQVALLPTDSQEVEFDVSDPEQRDVTISVAGSGQNVLVEQQGNRMRVSSFGAPLGSEYQATLVATDGENIVEQTLDIFIIESLDDLNSAPVIEVEQTRLSLLPTVEFSIPVRVKDKETVNPTIAVTDNSDFIDASLTNGVLTISSNQAPNDSQHQITLIASDGMKSSEQVIEVTTRAAPERANSPPQLILEQQRIALPPDVEVTIPLQVFDADGDQLQAFVEESDPAFTASIDENFNLSIVSVGATPETSTPLRIAVSDGQNVTAQTLTIDTLPVLPNTNDIPVINLSQRLIPVLPTTEITVPVDYFDPDGDEVTFAVAEDSDVLTANFVANQTGDTSAGLLTLTVTNAPPLSTQQVVLSASDGVNRVLDYLFLRVIEPPDTTNFAPELLIGQELIQMEPNEELRFPIEFSDRDNDILSIAVAEQSQDLFVERDSKTLTLTTVDAIVGSVNRVTVTVDDGQASVSNFFDVEIVQTLQGNRPPDLFLSRTDVTIAPTGSVTFPIEFSDFEQDDLTFDVLETADALEVLLNGNLLTVVSTNAPENSSFPVSVTVSDGINSTTEVLNVAIRQDPVQVNRPPELYLGLNDVQMLGDETLVFPIEALDPDGDELSFRITDDSDFLTVSRDGNLVTLQTAGAPLDAVASVTIEVSDGEIDVASRLTVRIKQSNIAGNAAPSLFLTRSELDMFPTEILNIPVVADDDDGDNLEFTVTSDSEFVSGRVVNGFLEISSLAAPVDVVHTLTVALTDGTVTIERDVKVTTVFANLAPVIGIPEAEVEIGPDGNARLDLSVEDFNGDPLSFTVVNNNDSLSAVIEEDNGTFFLVLQANGLPLGQETLITVAVTDGEFVSQDQVNVLIGDDSQAPRVGEPSTFLSEQLSRSYGEAKTVRVLAGRFTDEDADGANVITLTNDVVWALEGSVVIGGDDTDSTTLRIEPGTLIFGRTGGDSLLIRRASQLEVLGEANAPVVFTSYQDVLGEVVRPGAWGGIHILGKAPTNDCPSDDDCNLSLPELVDTTAIYGGTSPSDGSGTLQYMVVKYAGFDNENDQAMPALTLAGVGLGTTVNHVQVYQAAGIGIHTRGGRVSLNNLLLSAVQGDSLVIDEGYTGAIQFVQVIQDRSGRQAGRAIRFENNEQNSSAQPQTNPKLANLTLNLNAFESADGGATGLFFDTGAGGQITNMVVTAPDSTAPCLAVSADTESQLNIADGTLQIINSTLSCDNANAIESVPGGIDLTSFFLDPVRNNVRTNERLFDLAGLPLEEGVLFANAGDNAALDPILIDFDVRGAFGNTDWRQNWAYGYGGAQQYLRAADSACPAGTTAIEPVSGNTSTCELLGTQINDLLLTNQHQYALTGAVRFGLDNDESIVVSIDPGVTLFGATGDDLIYLSRGSTFDAIGTAANPITFTSAQDVYGEPVGPGQWGGILMLGNAESNQCTNASSCSLTLAEFGEQAIYGGGNDADSSGQLGFVRILNAGYLHTAQQEMPALTMAGVGNGGSIDRLQVHNSMLDGIEFKGGTPLMSRIVVSETMRHGIAWSERFNGRMQYLLVSQPSDDSQTGSAILGRNDLADASNTPLSIPTLANVTLIANSYNATPPSGLLRLSDGSGMRLRNSLFFGPATMVGNCLSVDNGATTQGNLGNGVTSISGTLMACQGPNVYDLESTTDLSSWFLTEQLNNLESAAPANVLVGSVTSTNEIIPDAIGDDFFNTTSFIGAISANDNWADGWTLGLP